MSFQIKDILKNAFVVPTADVNLYSTIKSHTGLIWRWYEGWINNDRIIIFGGNYPFKSFLATEPRWWHYTSGYTGLANIRYRRKKTKQSKAFCILHWEKLVLLTFQWIPNLEIKDRSSHLTKFLIMSVWFHYLIKHIIKL